MRTWIAATFPLLAGCLAGPWDGTWLFTVEREPINVSGDCYNPADTTVLEGVTQQWVDIYSTNSSVVVMFDPILEGEPDGKSLTAAGSSSVTTSGYTYTTETVLSGDIEDRVFTGTIVQSEENIAATTYTCDLTYAVTAERAASDSDRYLEE